MKKYLSIVFVLFLVGCESKEKKYNSTGEISEPIIGSHPIIDEGEGQPYDDMYSWQFGLKNPDTIRLDNLTVIIIFNAEKGNPYDGTSPHK